MHPIKHDRDPISSFYSQKSQISKNKAKTHLLETRPLFSKSNNCNTSAIIMLMKYFTYPIRIIENLDQQHIVH
jgi:hypothetical protein